ncbi:hypothetical protein QQX98_006480 [Neonectria punicea]|uniref:DUF6594 domain-containing protein n=1 Tax=Neonectria punicea TaxID=979145 RepID=A0ABR1H168_9HYPO
MSQPELSRAGIELSRVHQRNHATSPTEEATTSAVDLEAGNDDQREFAWAILLEHQLIRTEEKKGFLSMCARVRQDKSQLVTRRFTEPTMACLAWGANRIDRLWEELKEAEKRGINAPEKDKRYFEFRDQLRMQYQFTLETKDIHGLDQPSATFIDNFRLGASAELDADDARYLWGPRWDFVSALPIDKLDKLVWDFPHHEIGKVMCSWFEAKAVQGRGVRLRRYPQKAIKMLLSGVFNCIVGGLIGAPIATKLLAVHSQLGAVILYLAFLLAFAFLVQVIAHGTNSQLFMTLAYAGVLAAIMK